MKQAKFTVPIILGMMAALVIIPNTSLVTRFTSGTAVGGPLAESPTGNTVSVAAERVQLAVSDRLAYNLSLHSTGAANVKATLELILPDGARKSVESWSALLIPVPRGRSGSIDIAQYTSQTGNFVLECSLTNSRGAVVGRSALAFTVGMESSDIRFEDITDRAGVRMMHRPDPTDGFRHGTGVAMADYDQDDWLDIFVTDRTGANRLFRNNRDGTFTDVAALVGVANPGALSSGAAFADFDNDGDQDLYVGRFGDNVLYENNGDGTFTDVTALAGVQGLGRTESVAWGDYNGDGLLDLYVANHSNHTDKQTGRAAPHPNPLIRDYLYRNNGNRSFTDVTHLLPGRIGGDDGNGFIGGFLDYDNDGDADIYVVNDALLRGSVTPNYLWRNDGAGGAGGWLFTDVSKTARADIVLFGMGLAVGDYNRDGYLDMYFTNLGPSVLLTNNRDGTFSQMQHLTGVGRSGFADKFSVGWGCEFADFDNDGWEDLYLCSGHNNDVDMDPYDQPNALFKNNGDGTFTEVGRLSGTDHPGWTRTVAVGDIDNDGFMDIFLGNFGGPTVLYRNRGNQNRWLMVEAQGTVSNRNGVGARVTVTMPDGAKQIREIRSGSSLGAGSQIVAHFGLGQHAQVSRIEIRWPSKKVQVLENVAADQKILVQER